MEEKKIKETKELFNFSRIINQIAREEENKFHAKMENKFSPTDLVGCLRNAYFTRIYPPEYDDRSYRNFLIGDTFHEIFQKKLNDKDFVKRVMFDKIQHIENEKSYMYLIPLEKVEGERVLISGRLDTIFFLKDQTAPIIVDYKTTSNAYYNKEEPKLSHKKQLNFYLATNSADTGIIVYIDKRDLNIIQHEVKYSKEMFDEIVDNAVMLFHALKKKEPPLVDVACQEELGNCQYCLYKDLCKQIEIKKMKGN